MTGRRWECRSSGDGTFELRYGADSVNPIATVWWVHLPAHPTVVMTRLIDSLNLPGAQCAPSPCPVWSLELLPCTPGTIPAAWATFVLDDVEVMAVVWQLLPLRLDEWHQRILDALNPGRGLPAVFIPDLPDSRQNLFTRRGAA